MSLIGFHRFLIAAAILFCLGFAGWELRAWADSRNGGTLLLGLVFAVLGAGLIVYLRRLDRILGREEPRRPG